MSSLHSPPYRPTWGWLCIFLGLYPIAFAFDLFPTGDMSAYAPMWIVFLCGLVFVFGGAFMLVRKRQKINTLCVASILTALGTMGLWVSLFSPSDSFSGAFTGLTQAQNVLLARWAFGGGAVLSFAMGGYAIHHFLLGSLIPPGARLRPRPGDPRPDNPNPKNPMQSGQAQAPSQAPSQASAQNVRTSPIKGRVIQSRQPGIRKMKPQQERKRRSPKMPLNAMRTRARLPRSVPPQPQTPNAPVARTSAKRP